MSEYVTRRAYLLTAAAGGVAALAGCGGGGGGTDDTDEPAGTDGGTDAPTDDGTGGGGTDPPEGSFSFEYDPDLGQFTAYYDSGPTIDGDNTGLLVVDEYLEGELRESSRNIWYTGPYGTLEVGASLDGTYPLDGPSTLAVRWGPPGCEGDCAGSMVTLYEEPTPSG